MTVARMNYYSNDDDDYYYYYNYIQCQSHRNHSMMLYQ